MAALSGDLANALVASTPGGIERQEAEGTEKLIASDLLPIKSNATQEQLTKVGFVFGDPVDDLFIACQLPKGWIKQRSSGRAFNLIDEHARLRGYVFYKAAFYDRRASLTMRPYYNIGYIEGGMVAVVDYMDEVVQKFDDEADFLQTKAKQWLNENRPHWENPCAYW